MCNAKISLTGETGVHTHTYHIKQCIFNQCNLYISATSIYVHKIRAHSILQHAVAIIKLQQCLQCGEHFASALAVKAGTPPTLTSCSISMSITTHATVL